MADRASGASGVSGSLYVSHIGHIGYYWKAGIETIYFLAFNYAQTLAFNKTWA